MPLNKYFKQTTFANPLIRTKLVSGWTFARVTTRNILASANAQFRIFKLLAFVYIRARSENIPMKE